jgi:hypothetical protein
MARELGGSQISALLESVPGIVNVLRSPVADALVDMIRAGAGLDEFRLEAAQELIQYAVRRGLIGAGEGEQVLKDVEAVAPRSRRRGAGARGKTRAGAKPATKPRARKPVPKKPEGKAPSKKTATKRKAPKKPARQTTKRAKRR